MMLIVLLKFLALLGSILSLRNSLNSLIKASSRPLGWVGSRVVGSSWGVLAFGRFLVTLVVCLWKRGGV